MITATRDPMTSYVVTDIENAPYVVEGKGPHALQIYFEDEASKLKYLSSPLCKTDDSVLGAHTRPGDAGRSRALN